jgi:neutral trehalase
MKYHFCISPSWESGQDVSSRFGPQQTGGTIIQHVRPVDLQASMAQSAAILANWAELLAPTHIDETVENPYPAEVAFWSRIANEFTAKTRFMWRDGWFRDYDAAARVWSSERDAMHLAPVFCGVADPKQVEQLRPILAELPRHSSQWAPLSWAPVVMTLISAVSAAGMHAEAAELACRFIDAS